MWSTTIHAAHSAFHLSRQLLRSLAASFRPTPDGSLRYTHVVGSDIGYQLAYELFALLLVQLEDIDELFGFLGIEGWAFLLGHLGRRWVLALLVDLLWGLAIWGSLIGALLAAGCVDDDQLGGLALKWLREFVDVHRNAELFLWRTVVEHHHASVDGAECLLRPIRPATVNGRDRDVAEVLAGEQAGDLRRD